MTAVGAAGLYRHRDGIASDIPPLLWASMAFTILAELAFTLYSDPFGLANRLGHGAHFAAYLLIYAALVQTSLERPVESLFHLVRQRETELADAYAVEHEIAHRYLPAPGAGRIGGDFYDIFLIEDDLVGFAIGDVCGKGIKAAMTTMKARSALRAVALDDPEPSRVLEALNSYLGRELPSDSFVTAVFGTIDTSSGHVKVAVAGHPEPVVCSHPDLVLPEGFRAPPLSVLSHLDARTWDLDLASGESLVLVTDGVLEAEGVDSQFGVERLLDELHGVRCRATPEETVEGVLAALAAHSGNTLDDDVAIVVLQLAT
jgi:serine phosphatase RsbU (regulator of sigma subunit)